VVDHPVLHHALTQLRRKETPQRSFREEIERATTVLAVEARRALRAVRVRIHTPLEPAEGHDLDDDVVLVPILRAGLVMVDAFQALLPDARVGHVGLYRDESTHRPIEYYLRLPQDIEDAHVLVLDPMLATGGSAVQCIRELKKAGVRRMQFVCLIA